jgi:Ca2+-binding EF-hand superfamily protein
MRRSFVLFFPVLLLLATGLSAGEDRKAKPGPGQPPPAKDKEPQRRPSDVVFVLVEMSDVDKGSAEELQLIYNFLRTLDKKKDGKIDAGALKAARERLIEKRAERIFNRLDKNKDGKISKDEARGAIKSHFDELDKNKDGFVTLEELLQAMRARPAALIRKKEAPATKSEERPRDR